MVETILLISIAVGGYCHFTALKLIHEKLDRIEKKLR